MLTRANNYCVKGITIQGLILRQMHKAAIYTRSWYKAMNEGDENGEYTFCKLLNLEQAELYSLLEVQGLKRESEEFNMVIGHIIDMISNMANELTD